MNENELRQLEYLVDKYRKTFAWDYSKNNADHFGETANEMMKKIRMTLRNGGTYNCSPHLIKELA
jgi:hypothetical protein